VMLKELNDGRLKGSALVGQGQKIALIAREVQKRAFRPAYWKCKAAERWSSLRSSQEAVLRVSQTPSEQQKRVERSCDSSTQARVTKKDRAYREENCF
jgi:hypothetical protein